MTTEEAMRRFVQARVARLATVDQNGRPHLVPICFAVDAATAGAVDAVTAGTIDAIDTIYSAVDAKPKTTPDLKRLRNIEANPHVTLIVDQYDEDWAKVWWVRVDGTAEVHDTHTRGRAALASKYEQYRDAALGRVVVIRPSKWTAWAYTDLG